ncbi:Peptidase S8/S53 domain-containing protein [Cinnamomum micranthum f. kanehirae]|uniref:Peptidase S8/S53 domain-containing protein n=1 Tax=Cinnamomum micranthum f. kanehirae TaxID=337451 RepID=A0A3S3MKS3_9MAGN|nr:Peptidase S8/S53 domain-containing protein [Cinnamomum micranthum f. kanehirae]
MLLYSYSQVMHGFSASLTATQLSKLEKLPAHRATYHKSFGKLFTTHTPRYVGLRHETRIWPAASYGQYVIIGIIDTGIWQKSESFNGRGMLPVLERWKGVCHVCENRTDFNSSLCNRKLIGARSFSKGLKAAGENISATNDYDSRRDFVGHGIHTSSTAAGAYVSGADYNGYVEGTAKGVVPGAQVAMYKVVYHAETEDIAATDVLAAMDQAIADGVDIMSLSLGFKQSPYYSDVIATSALSAIEKGIFVACAAGNDGEAMNSTHNGAPWIATVGASDARKATCNSSSLNQNEVAGKVVLSDIGNRSDIYENERGKDVLAAWSPVQPIGRTGSNYLVTDYALLSGTSMAAPHVAGVAALLRDIHKDWSPATIRSAITTTAAILENTNATIRDEWTGLPTTPLVFGTGQINPNRAMDPGLVDDADFQDYIEFLCGLGYSKTQMEAVIRRSQWNCSSIPYELNYHSFIAFLSNTTGLRLSVEL